jgi:hypothetical protein
MNAAMFGARRRSISAVNASQLENPYSLAMASCATASVAAGSPARSTASRSFASFFRNSNEARSGRLRGIYTDPWDLEIWRSRDVVI